MRTEEHKHLMEPDPREAKAPVHIQNKLNDLRQALARTTDQLKLSERQVSLHASDMWLDLGSGDERWMGLGKRNTVRIPIGDARWPNGEPKLYVDVEAGRPSRRYGTLNSEAELAPVTHVRVRGSEGLAVRPDVSNAIDVYALDK
jgi:hypothetical protein